MATVTIQKRKRQNRNSYVIYFKDPFTGVKKYFKTFQRQKEAQQAANELRYLLDSGKLPDAQKNRLRMMTFGEVASHLENEWQMRLKTKEIRPKTHTEYVYTLNSVRRKFGSLYLCQITQREIENYRADVVAEFSAISANKKLATIKKVFKIGIDLRAATENPTEKIKYLSEKEHERNRFALPHQIEALVQASQATKAKYYLPVLIYLGAEHGTSKQEALSLRWSDIDFEFEGIGMIRFYRTKNKRERTDFLMPRAKKALLEWREHQAWMRNRKNIGNVESDLVFCHLNGKPIGHFNKSWWMTCEVAGMKDFHFHDLRHTFCSNLILSGAGLKEVKEMIGHSDISMTDRYSHLTMQHKFLRQKHLAEHYAKSSDCQSGGHTGVTGHF
ncbi:MAG: site-specific integrase [Proteobacteria bacterium]|nr:site-specific integrase [Pseudomonadota bacterium]MBU4297489.1 site-specific integrase [Pseudomonadota bacterium]MCG2749260.1 site-specific integrase [Desulfobulbaceae bacterium]